MIFIKGQIIKPSTVNLQGQVVFVNSAGDNCIPNKNSCEAYGYTWDKTNNTCQAFALASQAAIQNTTLIVGNKGNGPRNEIKAGSFYNDVNGADNTIGQNVQNSDLNGKGNVIDDNIHNVSVSGSYGKAIRQGERVLGGGNYQQAVNINGRAQSSTIHGTSRTVGAVGPFFAKIGGYSDTIPVQNHSVIVFDLTGTVIKEAGGSNWTFNRRIIATMQNNKAASFCIVSSSIDCGPAPEGWNYPEFLQVAEGEYEYGDLKISLYGIAEIDLTYNIKIDLIETRTINNF